MSDGSVILATGISLAQLADPISVFSQYGYPGLIILFLAVVWLDSKRVEKQTREDNKRREDREDARAAKLNDTLKTMNEHLARLLEKERRDD